MDALSYNRASARDLGWNPGWFGQLRFDTALVKAIQLWQSAHGLHPDGMVGPATYRKLFAERKVNVLSYNKATSRELGWQPSWFGATGFDWNLVKAIKDWQRARGLVADGKVGPGTYQRIVADRKARSLETGAGLSPQVVYNRASETKLGWKPSWFGAERNDEDLVAKVRAWQQRVGLDADGLVGNSSFRRIQAEREERSPVTTRVVVTPRSNRKIIFNGEAFPIAWDKVVLWNEEGGLKAKPGTFKSRGGLPRRDIKCFVNHWDVTTSAHACAKSFDSTGLSVHFCLDNDGTIYQLVDMQHVAWQAKGLNFESAGVEITNAFYPRFQERYVSMGFGKRPVWSGKRVHGGPLKDFLGFYDVQIQALKALWKAIHNATGVPLVVPTDASGAQIETVDPRIPAKTFRGFISHFQLTKKKIDCAGLDLAVLMREVRTEMGLT